MLYFMDEILQGEAKFYWVGMISNWSHKQFVTIKRTLQFYMTSYLVYLLANQMQYIGLFLSPSQTPKRELKVYDKYPQLQYKNFKKDYYRVNEAFFGHIIILIGGDFERRVTHSGNYYIHYFDFLFIQFPKFTYI